MSRTDRAAIAAETLALLEAGHYTLADGTTVAVAEADARCRAATRMYSPDELQALVARVKARPAAEHAACVEVHEETTLAGAAALVARHAGSVAALNFASAKNPGGGFLGGSEAQEESLARSSALYPSLMQAWPYYALHRGLSSPLYTDTMILSPGCPVFRDDDGALMQAVRCVSFITSAAPNAGAAASNRPEELAAIPATLRQRAEAVLALAVDSGHLNLVLGAWGCGVFRNDPAMVAGVFSRLLREDGWAHRFAHVRFSVRDRSPGRTVFQAFAAALA